MMKYISRFLLVGMLFVSGLSYGGENGPYHYARIVFRDGPLSGIAALLLQQASNQITRVLEFNADPTPSEVMATRIQELSLELRKVEIEKNKSEKKFYDAQTENVKIQQKMVRLQEEEHKVDMFNKKLHGALEFHNVVKTPEGTVLLKRFQLKLLQDNDDLPQLPVEEPKKPAPKK